MFILHLNFADRSRAADHMAGHKAWIQKGFDDGVFILAGTLTDEAGGARGGAILAHGLTRAALAARAQEDPFVAEGIVTPEIAEIAPSRTDSRLDFLAA